MKDKNAWNNYSPEELKALENLNKGYIQKGRLNASARSY